MQTRPQAASLVAYQFGEFLPGALEVSLTASGYFPSKINRVHKILWVGDRPLPVERG